MQNDNAGAVKYSNLNGLNIPLSFGHVHATHVDALAPWRALLLCCAKTNAPRDVPKSVSHPKEDPGEWKGPDISLRVSTQIWLTGFSARCIWKRGSVGSNSYVNCGNWHPFALTGKVGLTYLLDSEGPELAKGPTSDSDFQSKGRVKVW